MPAVVAGTFAAHLVDPQLLKAAFGLGLLVLGAFLVYYDPPQECIPGEFEGTFLAAKNAGRGETVIEARTGETFRYDTYRRAPGVAVATSVFVLAIAAAAGAAVHALSATPVWYVVA